MYAPSVRQDHPRVPRVFHSHTTTRQRRCCLTCCTRAVTSAILNATIRNHAWPFRQPAVSFANSSDDIAVAWIVSPLRPSSRRFCSYYRRFCIVRVIFIADAPSISAMQPIPCNGVENGLAAKTYKAAPTDLPLTSRYAHSNAPH